MHLGNETVMPSPLGRPCFAWHLFLAWAALPSPFGKGRASPLLPCTLRPLDMLFSAWKKVQRHCRPMTLHLFARINEMVCLWNEMSCLWQRGYRGPKAPTPCTLRLGGGTNNVAPARRSPCLNKDAQGTSTAE